MSKILTHAVSLGEEKHHTYAIFVKKTGIYSPIFGSKLESAAKLKKWVYPEVLPNIRRTGSYSLQNYVFSILTEYDLHARIVKYIGQFCLNAIIIPGFSQLQDTSRKRCEAWRKDYKCHEPNFIISKYYNGLCIELKTPRGCGKLSEKQNVVVFDNYDKLTWMISNYMANTQIMWSLHGRRFKNEDNEESQKVFPQNFYVI